MYNHTENKTASLRHLKFRAWIEEKIEIHCRVLDFGPVTLKLNHDLDILKMYHLQTENELAMSGHSKYIAWIEKVQK